MISPATLLLIERLIAIFTILIQAIDQAAGESGAPRIRRAAIRLLLSRVTAHLTRLRDSTQEAADDCGITPQPTPSRVVLANFPIEQRDPPRPGDAIPLGVQSPILTGTARPHRRLRRPDALKKPGSRSVDACPYCYVIKTKMSQTA